MSAQGEGLRLCEAALERLLENRPAVPAHVGLPSHKITAGVVSVEAGFDRGYIKKGRKSHMPLVARIEHIKGKAVTTETSAMEQVRRTRNALERAEEEAKLAKKQLAAALAQNLMLINQLRDMEATIERYQPHTKVTNI